MIVIMIISGFLSSMYVFSNTLDDVRISFNDFYMIGLMTGYMVLFMGLLNRDWLTMALSTAFVLSMYYLIRSQRFVTKQQYFRGMIPHHSMAVLMSRRLLENDTSLTKEESAFVDNIITTQQREIAWMKSR